MRHGQHRTGSPTRRGFDGAPTRRAFVGALAAGAAIPIAGCNGGDVETTTAGGGETTAAGGGETTAASGGETTAAGDGGPPTGDAVVTRDDNGLLPSPVAGDPDAEVTLAVFEDYACPHCANYNTDGAPSLTADYIDPGRIRYEHHDFPIPVANPGSWEAASAARAVQHRAGDEAFYDFAGDLFANYRRITTEGPARYKSLADDIGLDGAAIREAAVSQAFEATVRRDRSDGIESDVSSTPTFVVDGTIVAAGWGGETLSRVESALDERLGQTA